MILHINQAVCKWPNRGEWRETDRAGEENENWLAAEKKEID